MATARWIDSAAAAGRKRGGPSATFMDRSSDHVTAMPRGTEDAEQRERTRAARALVRLGRSADDPMADLVLEICGLSHDDADPGPSPRTRRLAAMTVTELVAEIKAGAS